MSLENKIYRKVVEIAKRRREIKSIANPFFFALLGGLSGFVVKNELGDFNVMQSITILRFYRKSPS
jgi:hypothetical protein